MPQRVAQRGERLLVRGEYVARVAERLVCGGVEVDLLPSEPVRDALELSLEPEFDARREAAPIAQDGREARPRALRRREVRLQSRERFDARAVSRLVRRADSRRISDRR